MAVLGNRGAALLAIVVAVAAFSLAEAVHPVRNQYMCGQTCFLPADGELDYCGTDIKYRVCGNGTVAEQDAQAKAYADGIASFTGMPLSNFSDVTCARSLQKLACKATFAACEIGQHTTALCSDTCAQVAGDCSGLPKNATDAILRLCETVQAVEGEHPHCKPFNYNGANVTDWIIGFSLQIVFALLSPIGINMQKHSINRDDETGKPRPVYQQPLWVLGFALVFGGSLVDFVAFGLAPQSLLAPLAGLALVWNMAIASWFMGEHLDNWDIMSSLVIAGGTICTVIFADHTSPSFGLADLEALYGQPQMVVYIIAVPTVMLIHAAVVYCVSAWNLTTPNPEVPAYAASFLKISEEDHDPMNWARAEVIGWAGLGGLLGGQSVLFAKSLMELVKAALKGDVSAFGTFFPYAILFLMLGCLYCQITSLNAGLRLYDSLSVVPVYQTYWMCASVLAGLIYFDELKDWTAIQGALFGLGIGIAVFGVGMLSRRKISRAKIPGEAGSGVAIGGAEEGEAGGDNLVGDGDAAALAGAEQANALSTPVEVADSENALSTPAKTGGSGRGSQRGRALSRSGGGSLRNVNSMAAINSLDGTARLGLGQLVSDITGEDMSNSWFLGRPETPQRANSKNIGLIWGEHEGAANTGLNLGEPEQQRNDSVDKEEGEGGSAYYKM